MHVDLIIIALFLIATIALGLYHSRGIKNITGLCGWGVYAFMIDLASAINFYLAARFVTVRMKEFLGHLSIAESMGSVYGSRVRMCTGILGIMMSISAIGCANQVWAHYVYGVVS